MDLYFYTKRKDVAATTIADLAAYIAALANPTTSANIAIISRITEKIQSFTQSDSGEPLNLYFSADGSTYESWSTDSGVTLTVGLGEQDPRSAYTYTSTATFVISGNARVGTLALNTTELRDGLSAALGSGRGNSAQFYLHVRKTTAGVTETVALLPVTVEAGVLTDPTADMEEITYTATAPTTSTSAGTAGMWSYGSDYFYLCTATNTWRRFPLNDWA